MIELISLFITFIMMFIAAFWDNSKRIIPNWITLPFIPVGLLLTYIADVDKGLVNTAVIVGLFFLGMTGMFGMGDLKLVMALTALQGYFSTLVVLIIASGLLVFQKIKIEKYVPNMKRIIDKKEAENGERVPFAPFMLIGYVFFVIVNYGGPVVEYLIRG